MSDILIVGNQPKSEVGKEYFLHCLDWWHEILHVLKELDGEIPFEDWFVKECWLCPPTPFMDEEQSRVLFAILKGALETGRADRDLDSFYHEDELMIDYFNGDEEHMKAQKEERLEQLSEFAEFLSECGGCRVKWSFMDEDW